MAKTLRVGMIGYGFMGKAHSNAWRQAPYFFPLKAKTELHTICGRNAAGVQAARAQLGWQFAATDWREVVESDADIAKALGEICGARQSADSKVGIGKAHLRWAIRRNRFERQENCCETRRPRARQAAHYPCGNWPGPGEFSLSTNDRDRQCHRHLRARTSR